MKDCTSTGVLQWYPGFGSRVTRHVLNSKKVYSRSVFRCVEEVPRYFESQPASYFQI
jgi:hypothetical protein